MCTVTYIPLGKNDFILTSNRDESPSRKTISPKTYEEDGVKLTYPKDEVAGGTWIGLSEKKRLVCLLNGGFKIHKRAASYKMSRGVVVKQLLKVDDALELIKNFDFENIEPFTIVLVDWQDSLKACELVWDGVEKHMKTIGTEPKIWSSATLYNQEMKTLREQWFSDWCQEKKNYEKEDILDFHSDTTKGNEEVTVKMKRSRVETVSITMVTKENFNVIMDYHSLA